MAAFELLQDAWAAFRSTKQGKASLKPIVAPLFDDSFVSLSGVSERELDAHLDYAAHDMPATVPQIFAHWQAQRAKRSPH
jgi:hypothetical protein